MSKIVKIAVATFAALALTLSVPASAMAGKTSAWDSKKTSAWDRTSAWD